MKDINPLPNNIILNQTKFKAIADAILIIAYMVMFVFDEVENIVGKGRDAGVTSIFSFSKKCFQKRSLSGSLKLKIVW